MDPFDLIFALLVPEVLVGCVAGLGLAWVTHWLIAPPELVLLEAAFVAGGCLAGMVWGAPRKKNTKDEAND